MKSTRRRKFIVDYLHLFYTGVPPGTLRGFDIVTPRPPLTFICEQRNLIWRFHSKDTQKSRVSANVVNTVLFCFHCFFEKSQTIFSKIDLKKINTKNNNNKTKIDLERIVFLRMTVLTMKAKFTRFVQTVNAIKYSKEATIMDLLKQLFRSEFIIRDYFLFTHFTLREGSASLYKTVLPSR